MEASKNSQCQNENQVASSVGEGFHQGIESGMPLSSISILHPLKQIR